MSSARVHDLPGRGAVVTGGNAGIGLGLARGLARAGAAIRGRNAAKNAPAAESLQQIVSHEAAVISTFGAAAAFRADRSPTSHTGDSLAVDGAYAKF
jgi:2-dehydro-3-deoxy-D-gluconate 5-dehydrogenase